MKKLILFIQFVILLPAATAFAQTGNPVVDSAVRKIDVYGLKKSSSVLFTHFDKTIYAGNEDVWFTTYLPGFNKKNNNPSIATVLLVSDFDKSIQLERHFTMNNGLSFGHLVIPEKIQPGNYSFIVYTNVLSEGMPVDVFVQHVTIKSISQYHFLTALRTVRDGEGNLSVSVKANFLNGKPVKAAQVYYDLGTLSGEAKTDETGTFLFKVPVGGTIGNKSVFNASVKFNGELNTASIALPPKNTSYSVHFYPEGGHFVNKLNSEAGVEIKNTTGAPVAVKAILYRNQIPTDTIITDNYGLGRFSITPFNGAKYELKVIGNATDTTCQLARPLDQGAVISVSNALCDDSLRVKLYSSYVDKYFVVIHNYLHSFYSFPVMVSPAGKSVLINLKELPRGLHTITLLDTAGRPVAERLFFAHYNQGTSLRLITDRKTYGNREKVTLNMQLGDKTKAPVIGLVSISCVETGRLDTSKNMDIESYIYLNHELSSMPFYSRMGSTTENRKLIENILLIKGWRKYTWQETQTPNLDDTINRVDSAASWIGIVSKKGKTVKQPVSLLVSNDSIRRVITTDKSGRFLLNRNMVTSSEDKVIQLRASDNYHYTINLSSKFDTINRRLLKEYEPATLPAANESSSKNLQLPGLNHVFNLKEVIIKDKPARRADGSLLSEKGSNDCGDYVCKENVLNCFFHAGDSENRPAIVDKMYGIQVTHRGLEMGPPMVNGSFMPLYNFTTFKNDTYTVVIYKGCGSKKAVPAIANLNGVYFSKEFYPLDFSKPDVSPMPDYQTTLYWKHLCFLNSVHQKTMSTITFYTNDTPGTFKIIVQGIAGNDVVYGETSFTVKGK